MERDIVILIDNYSTNRFPSVTANKLHLVSEYGLKDSDDKECVEHAANNEPFKGGHEGSEDARQWSSQQQGNQHLQTVGKKLIGIFNFTVFLPYKSAKMPNVITPKTMPMK